MRRSSFLLTLVTVLMAITVIYSCKNSKAPAGNILKFNPEKGKSYDYEIAWEMDQQMMEQNHEINITSGYTLDVIDDKDGIKTLKAVYKNFKMYMNIMGMEIKVDTDKPAEPINDAEIRANPLGMMDRVFAGIKEKEFTMKVNEEGKVLEVVGFDKIINEMIDSIGLDENAKMQVRASLQDQFNEQSIKDQFAQVFTIFPGREIKMGDSWEKNFQTGGRMPAKYTTQYSVKEIEGDHITLTAQTNIGSANDEMEIKGTQNGSLLVDGKTGLVINAQFDQDMETKAQDMTVKISGKGTIKGKLRQ
ncbi:MAG: DUF6263 family protein [Chitinophagaceae bacterium]